jgi:hypothetical protein
MTLKQNSPSAFLRECPKAVFAAEFQAAILPSASTAKAGSAVLSRPSVRLLGVKGMLNRRVRGALALCQATRIRIKNHNFLQNSAGPVLVPGIAIISSGRYPARLAEDVEWAPDGRFGGQ